MKKPELSPDYTLHLGECFPSQGSAEPRDFVAEKPQGVGKKFGLEFNIYKYRLKEATVLYTGWSSESENIS